MKKASRVRGVDYISLGLLIAYALVLLISITLTEYTLQKQHIAGLVFVAVVVVVFFINKKIGVVFLGLTLLLGVIGFISLNGNSLSNFIGVSGMRIGFQPDFLVLAIIHFICSGRHYIGIGTAAYWDKIFDNGGTAAQKIDE